MSYEQFETFEPCVDCPDPQRATGAVGQKIDNIIRRIDPLHTPPEKRSMLRAVIASRLVRAELITCPPLSESGTVNDERACRLAQMVAEQQKRRYPGC